MPELPFLYFVTPPISPNLTRWSQLIYDAIRGGVRMIQIRDKECSDETMIQAIGEIHPFLRDYHVPLIVNDRLDIARRTHVEGVHLGQSDYSPRLAREQLGDNAIIGISVETIEQATHAMQQPVDYLAASPLFATSTKPDCHTPWGLEKLAHLCNLSHLPVVAIGGIHSGNVTNVLEVGAQGIAVVSAISHAESPLSAAKQLLSLILQ